MTLTRGARKQGVRIALLLPPYDNCRLSGYFTLQWWVELFPESLKKVQVKPKSPYRDKSKDLHLHLFSTVSSWEALFHSLRIDILWAGENTEWRQPYSDVSPERRWWLEESFLYSSSSPSGKGGHNIFTALSNSRVLPLSELGLAQNQDSSLAAFYPFFKVKQEKEGGRGRGVGWGGGA